MTQQTIHATCISIDGKGILLRGPSGCGKSDLALRLIDRGARLVADDRVVLSAKNGALYASPPQTLSGFMEVRGLGMVETSHDEKSLVSLIVDLVAQEKIERMPEPASEEINGIEISHIRLYAFEASAPAKAHIALDIALGTKRLKP